MKYAKPATVISPKAHWRLVDVLLDDGPGHCAYAVGLWDDEKRIAFRWNGDEGNYLGNPQSRGLPTWVMLDPRIHDAAIGLLPVEAQMRARRFFTQTLSFDGVSLNENQTSIVFWNLADKRPIVATVACSILQQFLGMPDLLPEQCRLVAEANKALFEDVATLKLLRAEVKLQRDGKLRIIEIQADDLRDVARNITSTVLEVAKLSGWARL
jgi:hypothetical protein